MKIGRWPTTAAAAALVVAALTATAALAASGTSATTADAAQATAKFHSLAAAKLAGYALLKDKHGIACIAMPAMRGMRSMGAMGFHYVNGPLVADGRLNVTAPEALVYAPRDGKLRLAAVEYVVLKAAWDARHASPPRLFGRPFNLNPAGNRFGLPAFYSLHAWIWKHNPAGRFAMWNPQVKCS
jgi:hypothetical protein